eukprot:ANDGO_00403.mRNA.1 hypothetical protein
MKSVVLFVVFCAVIACAAATCPTNGTALAGSLAGTWCTYVPNSAGIRHSTEWTASGNVTTVNQMSYPLADPTCTAGSGTTTCNGIAILSGSHYPYAVEYSGTTCDSLTKFTMMNGVTVYTGVPGYCPDSATFSYGASVFCVLAVLAAALAF